MRHTNYLKQLAAMAPNAIPMPEGSERDVRFGAVRGFDAARAARVLAAYGGRGAPRTAPLSRIGRAAAAATRPLRLNPAAFAMLGRGNGAVAQAVAEAMDADMEASGVDVVYGLDSGAAGIAASTTATLSTTPQKRHVPTRISVSSTIASNFVLSAILVGVEPVLASTSNLSMSIFIQDSTAPNFKAVVCEVGMDFSLTITNITLAAQRFVATVIGEDLSFPTCR